MDTNDLIVYNDILKRLDSIEKKIDAIKDYVDEINENYLIGNKTIGHGFGKTGDKI